jgi:alpha-L-rhamnosidase
MLSHLKESRHCALQIGVMLALAASVTVGAQQRPEPSPVSVSELKCEYGNNPLGIDSLHPRLSWVLAANKKAEKQSAYQVMVASTMNLLLLGHADIWNTGKVLSSESIQVAFQGKPLRSGARYYWKVRIWDKEGRASTFSDPGYWEMGLLSPSDWEGGWIGDPGQWNGRALYFHYDFALDKEVESARAYVTGLGYYELHINGRRIGDHVLDPGLTNYTKRVLYSTYDVTSELRKDTNAIGVIVGNGWYGAPKLMLQMNITFTDHTQQSVFTRGARDDLGRWYVTTGPILQNSIYDGEVYDARLDRPAWDQPGLVPPPTANGEGWRYAPAVEPPGGRLTSQISEPIKVIKTLTPKAITNPAPGIYIVDSGQNLAGWAELHVHGPAGTKVTMKFAELLNPDGKVDQRDLGTARATDEYVLGGTGEEVWEPRFTYHGFRYIQIEGFPGVPSVNDIQIKVVRSSLGEAGSFTSDNELVNRIQQMVLWTEASNLYSIPTDCPQRAERMGWMNDLTVRLEESLDNFNGARFYTQFANDVEDGQGSNGAIKDTVPWMFGRDPADPVDESYLLIGWRMYQEYGDTEVIREHYSSFRAWVDYLSTRSPNHLINYGYYGDWSPPAAFSINAESAVSKDTPRLFMSQGYYYFALKLLSRMAGLIGKAQDERHYRDLAEQARLALNAKYWDPHKGGYAANNEASDSFGLFLGSAPNGGEQQLARNLLQDVKRQDWHLATGNLTTKYLLEALTENGEPDAAFRIATQTTYPSWGFMLANNATTLWERWELRTGKGMNSQNHPMMGSVSSYFYKYLAGINADPSSPGFKHSIIHPYFVNGLGWVKATHQTMYGTLGVNWVRHENTVSLQVTIPVNTTATVFVRATSGANVLVDGKPANETEGVRLVRSEAGERVFEVQSGVYSFDSML